MTDTIKSVAIRLNDLARQCEAAGEKRLAAALRSERDALNRIYAADSRVIAHPPAKVLQFPGMSA